MKPARQKFTLLAICFLAWNGCDERKSGPVEPTAVAATDGAAPKPTASAPTALFATVGPQAPVTAGQEAEVKVAITPAAGFKINKEYGWSFEFHPHDALELPSPSVDAAALVLDDARAEIPVKLTAKSAGEHTLTATGNFSVCNEEKCELYRNREVTFTIAATDG